MTFSEKLQFLRKHNGLSQEQVAEKLNVSRQAVSRWELGAIPDMENVIKISNYFDCSLDYLMNDAVDDVNGKVSSVREKDYPTQAGNSEPYHGAGRFHCCSDNLDYF